MAPKYRFRSTLKRGLDALSHLQCRHFPILCCLICLCVPLAAQLPEKDFYFQHINSHDGLSHGIINDIHRDRDGNLWIGTYDGLNCFDGLHFKTWKANPFDPKQLVSDIVQAICEDSLGNIWCATDGGISRFDRQQFRSYPLINSLTGKEEVLQTFEIICTRKGQVLTHTISGIYIYDQAADSFLHHPVEPMPNAQGFWYVYKNCLVEDPHENGVWIGTRSGMFYFNIDQKTYEHAGNNPRKLPIFSQNRVFPIVADPQGRLVYHDNTAKALVTYDTRTHAADSSSTLDWYAEPLIFSTIFIDALGNKWISTWNYQLFFQEAKSGKAFHFKHHNDDAYSVAADFFWDVFQDKDQTIYLGTIDGISLVNMRYSYFSIQPLPEGVNHETDYFGSLILNVDQQEHIWVAPAYSHLLRFNPHTGVYTKFDFLQGIPVPGKPQALVNAMEPSRDTLYFGTDKGIYTFDVRNERFAPLPDIPQSAYAGGQNIKVMELTRDSVLWFANDRNGLFRFDLGTRGWRHYLPDSADPHAITSRLVLDIHEDREGNVWISSDLDGLIRYNPQRDHFDYMSRKWGSRTPKGAFVMLQNDSENRLWMTNTVTGLCRYDPRKDELEMNFTRLGLPAINFGSIVFDVHGNLWMGYYGKFSILNPRDLSVENFIIDYSLQDYQYMNRMFRMGDGRIVSESRNALLIFNPDILKSYAYTDRINISNFITADTSILFIPEGEGIDLHYWQNYFSIDFSTLGFLKDKNLKFSYKLEGFDDEWVDCGSRQTAYYTNVPGGRYRFKVRVMDSRGQWHEEEKTLQIRVGEIFYKSLWFRLLLLVIFVMLIVWYILLWRKRALKRDFEKAISYFANSKFGNNNVEDILWDIAHNVITRTNMVDCVIYLFDEKREFLLQKAAFGGKNPEEFEIKDPIRIPAGKGIVGTVALSGRPEIIGDTSKDPRYIADDEPRFSEITVPIIRDGITIGVIDSEHPRRDFFTSEHMALLSTIADITATKILNAQKEQEIREKEKRLNELQVMVSETRQLALRAQMNPHFIFNCLNSINSFILENNADTASTYLIKFAKLIRLILENSNARLIPLQSELDALRLYIEMEALRFERKFHYQITVGDDIYVHDVKVPPLILQPFVENAIWHGLLHKEGEGHLQVRIQREGDLLVSTIEDDGVGRAAALEFRSKNLSQKKSLGLQLTQERLALMNEQDGRKFKVEIIDLKDAEGNAGGTLVRIEMDI